MRSKPGRGAPRCCIFLLLFFLVLSIDQATKFMVLAWLPKGQAIDLGLLDIRHVHNTGAAFGILPSGGYVFVGVAIVVLIAVALLYRRIHEAGPAFVIAVALICGGTVGNLLDRLRFAHVVDFIDLRWWPVFNVADSAICIGVGLLVLKMFTAGQKEV